MSKIEKSSPDQTLQVLKVYLGHHLLAVNILDIEDVVKRVPRTPVPLAAPYVLGVLNLRGHVVTEIDMAQVLQVGYENEEHTSSEQKREYSLIVNYAEDLYSLVFDRIGDVLTIGRDKVAPLPDTLDDSWKSLSYGVYRDEEKLLVLLDAHRIVDSFSGPVQRPKEPTQA